MHSESLKNQMSIHLIFSNAFVLRWVLNTLQFSLKRGLRRFHPSCVWLPQILPVFSCCVIHWENHFKFRKCVFKCLVLFFSTTYPFFLAPSIALLLDLGVSGRSDSEAAGRFSADFLSMTLWSKTKNEESIHKTSTNPTRLYRSTYYFHNYTIWMTALQFSKES